MGGLPQDHQTRLERARLSLDGLSLGDAFGQRFFVTDPEPRIAARVMPREPWAWTDDTAMAIEVVEVLAARGEIDRDELARRFGASYAREPWRGYGGTAHGILRDLARGVPWNDAAGAVFDGQGSMGNGGGMRAAPVGAYFAHDLERVAEQARRSAQPTHAHLDGQAGAMAVAVAAAAAWQLAEDARGGALAAGAGRALLERAAALTPEGPTLDGLRRAVDLSFETAVDDAVAILGSGRRVVSFDTVPFAIWCAARHVDNFEEALWTTVSGLGDRDTTCAMVGGIVALAVGRRGIPEGWLRAREPIDPDARAQDSDDKPTPLARMINPPGRDGD
jgi:ADP-ribosylglycohydrolase